MNDLKIISLSDIIEIENYRRVNPPSPEDLDMIELSASIAKSGLWQPILCRPHPNLKGKFQLIFGHRRRLGCEMASIREIPSYIREVDDNEILEAQVTENLHRKDVHPMDEAIAFEALQGRSWTVEDISARFGKSLSYVRQRIRLNTLIQGWQKVYFHGVISTAHALKIAALAKADQEDLMEKEGPSKEELKAGKYSVSLNASDFNVYKGDLTNAAFDITDPFLDKKMGACTSCPYNSASACLFPEDAKTPHCTNTACYKKKTEKSFGLKMKVFSEDPTVLFISTDYNPNQKDLAALKKEHGIEILLYGSYNKLDAPEPLNYDEWREDLWDIESMSEMEIKEKWASELEDYEKERDDYETKVATGRYKKALVVLGDDKGQTVYIQLNPKGKRKSGVSSTPVSEVKEKIKSGEASLDDVRSEIRRIEENLEKAAALDEEKVHTRIMAEYKAIAQPEEKGKLTTALTNDEWICLHWFLLDKAGAMDGSAEEIEELLDIDSNNLSLDDKDTRDELWKAIGDLNSRQLAVLFRFLMADLFAGASPRFHLRHQAFVMRKMAEAMPAIDIAAIEEEQQQIAARRIKTAEKRLAELREKEAELAPKKGGKKAAPAKAPKKSAKKKAVEVDMDEDPEDDE
jgi:ParB/RepB/Spo0J family partition protein